MNTWVKLLNREFSLAFQAEVPYVNRTLVPKSIGVSIDNYWCENVTFGVYYKTRELKTLAEEIQKTIISDPTFPQHNISDCHTFGNILLACSRVGTPNKLASDTNFQLLKKLQTFRNAYLQFLPYLVYPHAIERYFMEIIKTALKNHLHSSHHEQDFNRIYEILTTPTIHEIDEQIDLLTIAKHVRKDGWSPKNEKLLTSVTNKYTWQPLFSLTAKPLSNEYFKNAIQAYVDGKTNIQDELHSIKHGQIQRKNDLSTTLKQINAPKTLKSYVELLQGYMYLRTYRKNIIAKAHYLHLPLLIEIGERMGIGKDIMVLSYEEILSYLQTGEAIARTIIDKRREAWAILSINGTLSIISGKSAVLKVAKRYHIEDVQKISAEKIVHGQSACLGKVIGKVRIIKNISEFDTVHQDDILVTPMTTPDFVSLLQKVSAIVTDEGGVTCHAAIISREYHIPCIVGTGNATKIFANGDLIEVDADLGTAKIIK